MAKTDWNQVKEWDMKYLMHPAHTVEDYIHLPIEHTEGCYLYLPDGSRLLDFCSQLICVNLGQGNAKVKQAIKEAVDRYTFVWEGYTTDYKVRAAKLIMEDLMGKDGWAGRVRFATTGSEANEMALIAARLFTGRPNIITREYAYHGWTQGCAAATRFRPIRNILTTMHTNEVKDVPESASTGAYVVPAPFCYRCPVGNDYPKCKMPSRNGQLACVYTTEQLIRTVGPETVAAMITEFIQGAGGVVPPPEYYPQIRKMTKDLGILWIDDEVICGFGRCGTWFAYQGFKDTTPDIMTFAKGVVDSALPAAGLAVSKELSEYFDNYRWWTISTFAAHPIAMAAVAANIEAMLEIDLLKNVQENGAYLGKKLTELRDKHPCVGYVGGKGMLWCIDMVKNKETREPIVASDRYGLLGAGSENYPSQIVFNKCFEKGVIVLGLLPNSLRVGPSLTITKKEIDEGIAALDYGFSEVDRMIKA